MGSSSDRACRTTRSIVVAMWAVFGRCTWLQDLAAGTRGREGRLREERSTWLLVGKQVDFWEPDTFQRPQFALPRASNPNHVAGCNLRIQVVRNWARIEWSNRPAQHSMVDAMVRQSAFQLSRSGGVHREERIEFSKAVCSRTGRVSQLGCREYRESFLGEAELRIPSALVLAIRDRDEIEFSLGSKVNDRLYHSAAAC